ncbi:MAG: Cys-tRNA(Pro) deacylase [Micromonosporaceae bacterium]|nr:Cys-tRNA(Pro) deacylase [Micromonosporaceae bacterium]
MAAQGTPATAVLAREQVPHTLHRYEVPVDTPDYGRAVAAALDLPPERVFKTLIADAGGELTVAVVPVAGELDLKALAAAVGARRAAVADRAVAERATGYVRGGISPLGQRRRLPAVLDESVSGFETVYVSAGRRGLQVELAPADLVRLTGARLAPIAR